MTQRLLAVDQGSISLGIAAFDDRDFLEARTIRARGSDWAARMWQIGAQLRDHLAGEWRPDVVAIEGVGLHSGHRANPKTLAIMGMTRGYLIRVFQELAPGARIMEISPQRVKSAVGAPRSRARGKQHIAWAVQAVTGEDPGTEDARDAVAIGLAALEELHLEAMGVRPPAPRRRTPQPRLPSAKGSQLELGAHG